MWNKTDCSTDKFLNCRDLVMSYSNYDSTIQADLKVELQGWPLGIKFATPSAIGSTSDLKILRDALKTGECALI